MPVHGMEPWWGTGQKWAMVLNVRPGMWLLLRCRDEA